MWKLYNEANALQSEAGEDYNQYFLKPVDRKVRDRTAETKSLLTLVSQVFFDYYEIIKTPMTMNQIKRRIGKDPAFTLSQFRDDMHLVWNNARTYNEDGSWVFNAANVMEAFFDKMCEEEVPKLEGPANGDAMNGNVPSALSGLASGLASGGGSGTSTPMYKPQDKLVVPTKIKINMGGAGRRKAIMKEESDDEDEESENSDTEDEDEDDDDY